MSPPRHRRSRSWTSSSTSTPAGSSAAEAGSCTLSTVSRFSIAPGELLGLVGESGSGKSTVANCVMRLLEPTDGAIRLEGNDITHLSRRELRPLRSDMHMVFQDPYSSLNPRMTCGQIVGEPLRVQKLARGKHLDQKVVDLFDRVGLRAELRFRYPHELSGGQRQRVGLARALSVSPTLLVADEPVSALDVSVQAAILNLLRDLQHDMGFSCLFITHDLATVEYLCGRVAVMYLGKIVELALDARALQRPEASRTRRHCSRQRVVPDPEAQRKRRRVVLEGDIPSPLAPPSGCRFRTRCPLEHESAPASHRGGSSARSTSAAGTSVACHLVQRGAAAPSPIDAAELTA